MLNELFKRNWQFLFLYLLAAIIPYGINYWPYVIMWIFFWIYSGEYKKFKVPRNGWFWVFCSFFILHFIGVFYSNDQTDAIDIVQAETGFLLFPVLLSTYSLKDYEFKKILHIFCFSNIFLAAFLILRASYYSIILQGPIYTYSSFAFYMHPSYCSLYMVFSIAILYLSGLKFSNLLRKDLLVKLGLASLLTIAVLFCSSKIGMINLALTIFILGVYLWVKLKSFYPTLVFFVTLSSLCFVFVNYVPSPIERIHNVVNDYKVTKGMSYSNIQTLNKQTIEKGLNQKESVIARIFIWGAAMPVMKEHILFGVGPGDVTSEMAYSAEKKGISTFDEYNMHNQFIETQMGLGLPGLFVLLMLTAGILVYSFRKRDLLLSILSLIVILSCGVESMFRMDYFSMFFSFFLYLFIKANSTSQEEVSPELS